MNRFFHQAKDIHIHHLIDKIVEDNDLEKIVHQMMLSMLDQ